MESGESYKQMADIKYALEDNVKQNFIEPLRHLQSKDLKEVNVSFGSTAAIQESIPVGCLPPACLILGAGLPAETPLDKDPPHIDHPLDRDSPR